MSFYDKLTIIISRFLYFNLPRGRHAGDRDVLAPQFSGLRLALKTLRRSTNVQVGIRTLLNGV
jgi:hypothetical protein